MNDIKEQLHSTEKDLAASVKCLTRHIGELDSTNINGLLSALVMLRSFKKFVEDQFDSLTTTHNILISETVPGVLEELGLDSVKTEGHTFTLGSQLHASIPNHKMKEGLAWLRENSLGDIIKEGVNPKTLSSALKDLIEEKGVTPPEDAITMHIKKVTSVRKSS